MSQLLFCGVLLLHLLQAPALQAPAGNNDQANYNLFSVQQDIEIGTELAKQADKSLPLVRNAGINTYIQELGARLARSSPSPALKYRFRIINSDDEDAVTFPGGAVYVDRGLAELTANEHELAALLAHEIAHAAARHGTEQLSRQLLVQSPASIITGTREGWKEQLAHLGITFGGRAPFLRYGESQEIEANAIAVQILIKSGYSPYALAAVLEKIYSTRPANTGLPAYSYHHPQGEKASSRLAAALHELKTPALPLRATPAFRSFHASLAKLPLPADNPLDTASNAVLANQYVHPEGYYRLSYPEGWMVTSHGANGAIIAPPGGIQTSRTVDNARPGGVQTSRTVDNVGAGVVFDLGEIDRPMKLEQATERLIVQLQQSNDSRDPSVGYRALPGSQLQILIGSEPALRTVLIGKLSVTQPTEIVWVVTRLYYQNLFYLLCVSPQEEFDKYQPIFEQIIRSVELRER